VTSLIVDRVGAISLTWYDVLLELNAAPDGRLRMQEVADRVVLSRTRVSRLADEMVAAGLVTKARDDTDRRVVWATITEPGARAFRETAPLYLRSIEQYFSRRLSADEKTVVARALTKVNDANSDPLGTPTTRK
jgi:DNA-binding MarR family transcriptional regulator